MTPTEYLMLMRNITQVDMCLHFEVALFHKSLYKQTILTSSTIEAKLTALDTTASEVERICELLIDLLIVEKLMPSISMDYNNQSEQL